MCLGRVQAQADALQRALEGRKGGLRDRPRRALDDVVQVCEEADAAAAGAPREGVALGLRLRKSAADGVREENGREGVPLLDALVAFNEVLCAELVPEEVRAAAAVPELGEARELGAELAEGGEAVHAHLDGERCM